VFPPGHSLAGRELTWHRLAVEARAALAEADAALAAADPAPQQGQLGKEGGERERCAKIVESMAGFDWSTIAAAIRGGYEPPNHLRDALARASAASARLHDARKIDPAIMQEPYDAGASDPNAERPRCKICGWDLANDENAILRARAASLEKQLNEAREAMMGARNLLDFADADEQHAWHVLDKAIRALAKEEA
jgi:hypothetical protein